MAKKNPYYDASKPHHTEFGFQNLEPVIHHPQDLKRWREERKRQSLPKPRNKAMRSLLLTGGNRQISAASKMPYGGWVMPLYCYVSRGKRYCLTRYCLVVLPLSIFTGLRAELRHPPV